MTVPNLGRLERVDLREAWTHEAYAFTPWLAQEENLALLGDTIGIELELDGTEKSVGPFSADILCRDTLGGAWVLIENQLERTDHTHLGQLLTYAAGLNAVTIVWIAARFTEEHRAALDWLNEVTGEDINFFGLEVELWRIGDSAIAPKFNVVSKPNDWTKRIATMTRGELSESEVVRLAFWTGMAEYLDAHSTLIRPRRPLPRGFMDFSIGRSGFWLSLGILSRDRCVDLRLYVAGDDAETHFNLLHAERDSIEEELGFALDWQLNPDAKQHRITYRWEDEDIDDPERWPEQYAKFTDMLERFYRVFAGRVKRLDASDYVPEEKFEGE